MAKGRRKRKAQGTGTAAKEALTSNETSLAFSRATRRPSKAIHRAGRLSLEMLMIVCSIHGGHFSSLFVSGDVGWAMHQGKPIPDARAVLMLGVDHQLMLSCIVSLDFVRHYGLVSGSLDEAQLDSNDEWVHHIVPVCGLCFQDRFGPLPQLDRPFPNHTGYYLLIHPCPSAVDSS